MFDENEKHAFENFYKLHQYDKAEKVYNYLNKYEKFIDKIPDDM